MKSAKQEGNVSSPTVTTAPSKRDNKNREKSIRTRIENVMHGKPKTIATVGLTREERAAIAHLPASQALDVALALQKEKIPINRRVIKDIEQFCDENLHSPLEKLSFGKMNDLYRANYKEFRGIFRIAKKNNLQARIVKAFEKSSSPVRDKSTYMLDQQLGFEVIPRTAFAIHKDNTGKVMAGIVMEFNSGINGKKIPCIDIDITNSDVGRELLKNRTPVQSQEQKEAQCKLFGLDDFTFTEDGRVTASYSQSPLNLSDPMAKRELIKLQILDFLAAQVDRHVENYMVVTDRENGAVQDLKGIDNDLSFNNKFKTLVMLHDRVIRRRPTTTMMGLPEIVDDKMRDAILKLTHDDVNSLFSSLLPKQEIDGVNMRLDILQEHVRTHCQIIDSNDWNEVNFQDKTRSYIARDMPTPGLPLAAHADVRRISTAPSN